MYSNIQKLTIGSFVITTFLLLLYRITLHADNADEIMNLSIAYRIVLGDIPFYDIQEPYQLGAIFFAPFMWIYVKLTGGLDGIILYSRVIYVMVMVLCAVYVYCTFRKYMRKEVAFFMSYIVVFFEMYSLYYLWYDSESVIFCLIGDLTLIKALEEKTHIAKRRMLLIVAGGLHLLMAVAHIALAPMAVGIAIVIFLLEYKENGTFKVALKSVLMYALVPLCCMLIGGMAIIASGKANEIWLYLLGMLEGRGASNINFIRVIYKVLRSYAYVNKYYVIISVPLIVLYFIARKKKELFLLLAYGIIVFPIANQYVLPETSVRGLPNYLSYIALWAPLLYMSIEKKEKIDRYLLYVFWCPLILSALFIPLFSVEGDYGPIKSWQMGLIGAVVTLYYLYRVLSEKIKVDINKLCCMLYAIITFTLLLCGYKYVFLNKPLIEFENERIESGIYRGIKVSKEMEYVTELESIVDEYTKGYNTILVSSEIREIYLMSDLHPVTEMTERATIWSVEGQTWERQVRYFDKHGKMPEIMFLQEYDIQALLFEEKIAVYYEKIAEEMIDDEIIYIYARK